MAVLGVDISKAEFHCCLLVDDASTAAVFKNNPAGFRRLLKWLEERDGLGVHACMEATGPYWRALAEALYAAKLRVSVVNPSRTLYFARSQLRRTKTDAVDAQMLARFCLLHRPDLWSPPPRETLELRALLTYRSQLVAQRLAQKQLISQVKGSTALRKIHAGQLRNIEKGIAAVDGELRNHIKQHERLRENVARLETIPGFGTLTAATVVAHLPVERLRDRRAVAAYAGVSPSERQSGTSLSGKPRICKTGNAELRRALYMPAVVALRFNPALKPFIERLQRKGKPAKVVITAVMRKLLVLAFTLLRTGQAFDAKRA